MSVFSLRGLEGEGKQRLRYFSPNARHYWKEWINREAGNYGIGNVPVEPPPVRYVGTSSLLWQPQQRSMKKSPSP